MPPLVCFDTNTLIHVLKAVQEPSSNDPVVMRANHVIKALEFSDAKIMLPAIVLAEYLIGIELDRHPTVVSQMTNQFICQPFDVHCARAFAKLRQQRDPNFVPTPEKTRAALKADCMVVATAIAKKADCVISNDRDVSSFARTHIDCWTLASYPTPPIQSSYL